MSRWQNTQRTTLDDAISIASVDLIAHALGAAGKIRGSAAYVVRFTTTDAADIAPEPMVLAAVSEADAREQALRALAAGWPFFRAGSDPVVYWAFARDSLRTLILIETARATGVATEQMRRLQRARAIDQRLWELNQAFEGPQLTKKSLALLHRGQITGLEYEPEQSPIEQLEFAYTECDRRAALLVNGAPFQPMDVVGLTLEFATLLREAQLHEARLVAERAQNDRERANLKASPTFAPGDVAAKDEATPEPCPSVQADELLFVSTREAARRLGVSANYLAQLRVRGGGPRYSKMGRSVRYSVKGLCDWANARARSSTADVSHVL